MASQSCDVKKISYPFVLVILRAIIANSLTCVQLHKRAEKIAVMLGWRGDLQDGDHALWSTQLGKKRGCADQPLPEEPCITPIGARWPCCVTTEMGPDPSLAHSVDCVLCAV